MDGPAASGKTAVGQALAERLGWRFLDTGPMYRALTLVALDRQTDLTNEQSLTELANSVEMRLIAGHEGDRLLVDGQDVTDKLREPKIDRAVSLVAQVSGVRSALVKQQKKIAREGRIVMVGRDIGTVVMPKAGIKVFLRASEQVRARRRYLELRSTGRQTDHQSVLDDLLERDRIDSEREDSPLRPAADAYQVDTDNLSVERIVEKILSLTKRG